MIICIPIIIKSIAINLLINNLPQKGMILIPTEIIMVNIPTARVNPLTILLSDLLVSPPAILETHLPSMKIPKLIKVL